MNFHHEEDTMDSAPADEEDRRWMRRALDLAKQAAGLASPNPLVGCVVVRDGESAGEGWHEYDKLDHAEIAALKAAGERARGATAYTTLEPCSRQGRTGPCADALIAAGVKRVVIATRDPNPSERDEQDHGRGIEKLKKAGIEVKTGVFETEARRLNDAFAKHIRTGRPLVTLKIATSLDGRIAPAHALTQSPYWITGEEARAEVQKMRHAADAVLTGVGTIVADNPHLTDRSGLPRRRPLLRVVLDSNLRTPPNSRLIRSAQEDVLILYSRASTEAQHALEGLGVQLEPLEEAKAPLAAAGGRISLEQALDYLGSISVESVIIEGGANINSAVIERDLADKLVIFYAPLMLGGDALPMLASKLKPLRISDCSIERFGRDFAVECALHDPWAGVD